MVCVIVAIGNVRMVVWITLIGIIVSLTLRVRLAAYTTSLTLFFMRVF